MQKRSIYESAGAAKTKRQDAWKRSPAAGAPGIRSERSLTTMSPESDPMTEGIKKQKCRRCHRMFTPAKEGQQYGEKCARKIAALQTFSPFADGKDLAGDI